MTKATSFSVIGSFTGEFGVGQHARIVATSLDAVRAKYDLLNTKLGPHLHTNKEFAGRFGDTNHNPINLLCFNIFDIPDVVQALGSAALDKKFNISYGYWEFDTLPTSWNRFCDLYDEFWAPTKFIADAYTSATDRPVVHMPLAVYLPEIPKLDREHFGLPKDKFLFLFHFDGHSYPARKNPHATIRAFKRAFKPGNEDMALVIKSKNLPPAEIEGLEEMIDGDTRIKLLIKDWTKHEVTGLENVCDAYISLHRSEGFGLGPAEMMLLGKPVVVTGYSGNTDFTLKSNSLLVDYKLVPVQEGEYMFYEPGQMWAEPDIDHAAWHMRALVNDANLVKRLGTSARQYMAEHHSPQVCGAAYLERIRAL
jgi:glycosyltransferase involved in cell wall biosynthesis